MADARAELAELRRLEQLEAKASGQNLALADARKRASSTPGIVRALSAGGSFNWADNLDAAFAANDVKDQNRLRQMLGVKGPVPYSPQQAREAVLQAEREAKAQYGQEHPVLANVANLVGAIGSPANKVLGPLAFGGKATGATRMAQGALAGGVAGGIAGAGEEGQQGIMPGGFAGAALGAILPPGFQMAARLASPLARAGVNALPQNVVRATRAGLNAMSGRSPSVAGSQPVADLTNTPNLGSKVKAARVLQRAIDRDAAAGVQFKPGQNPMYDGGDELAGVYEVLAQHPGVARPQVLQAVDRNRASTARGMADDISKVLGGKGDFFEYQSNLAKTQRETARQGMDQIGDQLVTLDTDSIQALRSDLARDALKKAAGNLRASVNPAERDQANSLTQIVDQVFDKPSGVTMRVRDAQTVSEKLLKAADTAYRGGDGDTGAALSGLGRAIRQNARTPERGGFQEYDTWLKQYGTDSQNREALELGRKAFSSNVWPEEIERELSDAGPAAILHYQKGVAEDMMNRVARANGDMQVIRALLKDQNAAAKIRLAFPDDQTFAAFVKTAEKRAADTGRNQAFTQNSRTAFRQAAMADMEGAGAHPLEQVFDAVTSPIETSKKAAKAALSRLPGQSRGAVTDPIANAALGKTALDPDEVTALLNLLQASRAQGATAGRLGSRLAVPLAAPVASMAVR